MAKKIQKKQNNKPLYIASAVCALCVVFMLVALLVPKEAVRGEFTPPAFAANAEQGVPTVSDDLGWYTPQAQGLSFKVSVCAEVIVKDGKADIYFTNYEENDVWLMARIVNESGTVLAESGIIKQGEYLQTIEFDKLPKNGQTLYYKVMAYEPNTYYSAGTITLEAVAQIGG